MAFYKENISVDKPRQLSSSLAVSERRAVLSEPHMVPLANFVQTLRLTNPGWEFPDFDPLDGGVEAEILFLFEKPGPMTSAKNKGSGFISRNNDDPTAHATFVFMNEAGLKRKRTLIWNVIPGWNGTRKVTASELRLGVVQLEALIPLLPNLTTIVLVGSKAKRAMRLLKPMGLCILTSAHPSPIVRATRLEEWRAIPTVWAKASSS